MRVLLFQFLFIIVCSGILHAQDSRRNAVYLEIGGHGGWYSLNYERSFSKGFSGRIGFAPYEDMFTIPVSFGKVFGENKHHLELAAGLTYGNYKLYEDGIPDSRVNMIVGIPFVGYRFQKPSGRFFFRAGLTPYFRIYNQDFVNHPEEREGLRPIVFSAGIGFGYRF